MRNFKRITALLLVLVMCLAYIPSPAHAAALSDLEAVDGTVVLDGTNPGTVTVAITTPSTISITAVQGNWSITEEEGSGYLTMTDLGSDNMTFTGMNDVEAESGYIIWADDTYSNPAVFEKDEQVLYATYSVAANTPAGEYTVIFDPNGGIYDEEWDEYFEVFTCKITVTVESGPTCSHESTKLVQNGDRTHNVVCADEECGAILETVECSSDEMSYIPTGSGKHQMRYFCDCGILLSAAGTVSCEDEDSDGKCDKCGWEFPCDHEGKTYTYETNGDGTHKVICACGETIDATADCDGTATCTTKAKCSLCKAEYGDYVHDGTCEECAPAELVAVDGSVTLDGTNPGTVTVAISTTNTFYVNGVQGNWSIKEEEKSGYLTLTDLGSDNMTFTGMNDVEVESGYVIWADDTYENPALFEKDDQILYATYNVAANTPAGEYTVVFVPDGGIIDDEWVAHEQIFTFKITVIVDCSHENKTYSYENNGDDTHKVICSCGEIIDEGEEHNYADEVSRTEATCMATGSVTKKCACGAENTETLPIDETNHTKQNTTVKGAEEATCGADGYTGDTYCECGVKIADGETIPATGAHVYTTEVSRTEATCMATGSVTKKCACGAENTETLPVDPSNHTGELVYINNGDDIHTVKCECGETVIEAESHDYTTGTADHTCVCGKVEQFTITWTVNGEKVDETKVAFGAAITAPDYTAPTGYAFSGWTVPSTMPAENITLNATLVKTYKLRLNPDCVGVRIASVNGVDADSLVNAQKYIPVKEGEDLIIVLENTVSQREDVFVYDYTIGSAFVDVYQNTTTITIPGDKVTGNVTIFAAGMVNLTVDMAGGYCTDETYFVATEETNVVKMADSMAHAGSSVCIGSYFAREGYELVKLVAADGTEYRADRYIAIKGDLELTAVWEKIPEFTLTVNVLATDEDVELTVPYGANLLEVLAQAAEDGKIPAIGERIRVKDESFNGERMPNGYSYFVVETEYWVGIDENFTMPAADFEIDQDCSFVGWYFSNGGAEYDDEENGWLESGWHYIEEDYDDVEGGAWYYFDEIYLVTGLTRVPYPTEAVGGITYAPDAETLAYAESKGIEFIDADEAWFVFGQDGKFDQTTGLVGTDKYAVNGMLAWHPGVVEVDGEYYYFTGDEVNGGNIMATGDVYVQRNTTDRDFVIKGVYTFGEDGILCEYDGITDMANGTKRYYDDAQLMAGLGLTKVGENYIYVRSNGELVVNNSYYIPANALNIVPGTYEFDENGYMIQPELTTKEGVYFENGAWYYYENGVKAYNKGLITVSDAKWYNGEDVQTLSGTIYVRSNGALATGTYYVTNVDNYSGTDVASGDKCTFDANGLMQAQKNGIVDGKFYVNGKLAYNAGLIEYNGGYIYVRSNGVVVMGQKYWITNVNDTGVVAKQYSFDANGFLQNPEFVEDLKNGIVDGYYYVDGNLAYCAGLIKLSDENGEFYIYVRSNGALATGKYWPTNCNGIDVNGALNFGTDGKCYI